MLGLLLLLDMAFSLGSSLVVLLQRRKKSRKIGGQKPKDDLGIRVIVNEDLLPQLLVVGVLQKSMATKSVGLDPEGSLRAQRKQGCVVLGVFNGRLPKQKQTPTRHRTGARGRLYTEPQE